MRGTKKYTTLFDDCPPRLLNSPEFSEYVNPVTPTQRAEFEMILSDFEVVSNILKVSSLLVQIEIDMCDRRLYLTAERYFSEIA